MIDRNALSRVKDGLHIGFLQLAEQYTNTPWQEIPPGDQSLLFDSVRGLQATEPAAAGALDFVKGVIHPGKSNPLPDDHGFPIVAYVEIMNREGLRAMLFAREYWQQHAEALRRKIAENERKIEANNKADDPANWWKE